MAVAYCGRDGRIYVGSTVPDGMVILARGADYRLRHAVIETAIQIRRGQPRFRVPGIPPDDPRDFPVLAATYAEVISSAVLKTKGVARRKRV